MARDAARELAELDAVCSALAHATRRQILLVIHYRGGSMTAGDIAARFGHAWPTTTRHLGVLVEAGLVVRTRVGRTQVYRLDRRGLAVMRKWLLWFEEPAAGQSGMTERAAAPKPAARPVAQPHAKL